MSRVNHLVLYAAFSVLFSSIVGIASVRILEVTPQPTSMPVGRLWGNFQNPH